VVTSVSVVATFLGMSMLLVLSATTLWVGFGALVTSTLTSLDSKTSVARYRLMKWREEVCWWVPDEVAFCLPLRHSTGAR
jgi:hypothetical protein